MTTFRSEVVDRQEIDRNHPIGSRCIFAAIPNTGSGDSITNLVDDESKTFAVPLVWDGGVPVGNDVADTVLFSDAVISPWKTSSGDYLSYYDINPSEFLSTSTGVFFKHHTDNKSSVQQVYEEDGNLPDILRFSARHNAYSESDGFSYDYVIPVANARYVAVLHWSLVDRIWRIFINGENVYTSAVRPLDTNHVMDFEFSLGGANTRYYSGAVMITKDGSSFSNQDVADFAKDPHQIYKKTADEAYDYSLKFDGVDLTAQTVLASSTIVEPTGTHYIEWEIIVHTITNRGSTLVELSDGTNGGSLAIQWNNAGKWLVYNRGNLLTSTSDVVVNERLVFRIAYDGADYVGYLNGVEITRIAKVIATLGNATFGWNYLANDRCEHFSVLRTEYVDEVTPSNNRYFDFNRTSGTVVPELIAGENGTLTNFSGDSGWVPILDTQTFTIGAGKDYETLTDATVAQRNPIEDVNLTFTCTGTVHTSSYGWNNDSNVVVNLVIESDQVFTGEESLTPNFTSGISYILYDTLAAGSSFTFRNMHIQDTDIYRQDPANLATLTYENCYLDGMDNQAYFFVGNDKGTRPIARGCVLTRMHTTVGHTTTNYSLYDCIVHNVGGAYSTWGSIKSADCIVVNTIVSMDEFIYNYGVTTPPCFDVNFDGSNSHGNISSDSSATDREVGTGNVDFTGAYVNG